MPESSVLLIFRGALNIFLNNDQTYDEVKFLRASSDFNIDNLTFGNIKSPVGPLGLETFNPTTSTWSPYLPGSPASLDNTGKLLVRTSLRPEQDNELESSETFRLIATDASTPAPSCELQTDKFLITGEPEFAMETQLAGTKTVLRFNGADTDFSDTNTESIVLNGENIGTITYSRPISFDKYGGAGTTNDPLAYLGDTRTSDTDGNAIDRYVEATLFDGTSYPVTVTLTTPQSYVGFWWSAADKTNLVKFYSNGELIETFSFSQLYNAIPEPLYGNPNTGATRLQQQENSEPFVFLNFFAKQGTFDKIIFETGSSGDFEFDNLTFGNFQPPAAALKVSGTATILDENNGVLFSGLNTDGVPDSPGEDSDLPEALDDDRPPVANDDSFSVAKNGTTAPLNLLSNDTDPANNPLSVASINGVLLTPGTAQAIPITNGTVNVAADGTITFTPTAGYSGPISFPYVISDGTATDTADVTGTVIQPFEGLSQRYWGRHIPTRNKKGDSTWREYADGVSATDTDPVTGTRYKDQTFEKLFFGGSIDSIKWGSKVKCRKVTDIEDIKLTDAINIAGGGKFALARDAVAAVLNAERNDITYKYTAEQVISMVRDAFNINDSGANSWTIASLQAELGANNNLGVF